MSNELICTYPDPVLRRETVPVTEFNDDLVALVEKMKEIMLENDGVGLAGPQIGLSLKIAVVFHEGVLYPLINPVILESEGTQNGEEGCLSFPDVYGNVTRPQYVKVRTADLEGEVREIEADGFLARAFSHEIDHLNGKLLIDHFSPLKKSMARKKMLKRRREK